MARGGYVKLNDDETLAFCEKITGVTPCLKRRDFAMPLGCSADRA